MTSCCMYSNLLLCLRCYHCSRASLDQVLVHLKKLPLSDAPEVFGLHDNANITSAIKERYDDSITDPDPDNDVVLHVQQSIKYCLRYYHCSRPRPVAAESLARASKGLRRACRHPGAVRH